MYTVRYGSSSMWQSRTHGLQFYNNRLKSHKRALKQIITNSRQELKTSWNLLISDLPDFTAWSLYEARQREYVSIPFIRRRPRFLRALVQCLYELINSWLSIALDFSSPAINDIRRSCPKRTSNTSAVDNLALLCTFSPLHLVRILTVVKWFNLFSINSFLSPSIQPSMRLYRE